MGQLGWLEDEGGEVGGGDCSGSACIEMAFSGGSNLDRGPADPDVDEINRAIMVGRANNKGLPAAEFAARLTVEILFLGVLPPIGRTVRLAPGATRAVCFEAGTSVVTVDGKKPIETIEPGDLVWSRDENSGEATWKPVVQTYVRHEHATLRLLLGTETSDESLSVTAEHPFWRYRDGWVAAGALAPGDLVWSSGGWLEVRHVQDRQFRTTVYNLEVEGFHTYFVGDAEVWVHNTCLTAARELAISSKLNFSRLSHAAERAVERAGVGSLKEAREALRALAGEVKAGNFTQVINDARHADRLIVPFRNNTALVFRANRGRLEIRTVLELGADGLPATVGEAVRFSFGAGSFSGLP